MADNPRTIPELCAGIARVHSESAAYWSAHSNNEFFAPIGVAWSPADHVRHLTKSIRPVASAFKLPRIALGVLFGTTRTPSRTYERMQMDYQSMLAERAHVPGGAAGRFTPRPIDPASLTEALIVQSRERIMRYHATAVQSLLVAANAWTEKNADRYRIPHLLLGKLTLREMLCFTLYHNVHHVHVAERRKRELL